MSRVSVLLFLVVLLAGAPAAAQERVPDIPDRELPKAGTCAPMRSADVTIVTIGPRTDLRWFRVSGHPEPVLFQQLVPLLKRRAGAERPSRHAVWITASGGHVWAHAMSVRRACAAAGIYRVGLRVRSEATGEIMGFPLFLPAAASARPSPVKAGRFEVKVKMVPERQSKVPSDAGYIYAAARAAYERRETFDIQKVVADLWLPVNAPLQYAVTAIDYLYRGGCAGVRLRGGVRVPRIQFKVVPKIEIQGGKVSSAPQLQRPPPIRPRSAPWPVDGASEPGWVDLTLVDLPPVAGAEPKPPAQAPEILPNYAAQGGVPDAVFARVEREARAWAKGLGLDMLKGVRGGPELERRLAAALRTRDGMRMQLEPARRTFPDATAVVPSTLLFNVFLFHRDRLQGRVDVTVGLAGSQLAVILASWKDVETTAAMTLPPFPVDPYAGGEPALFRVWMEGLLDRARRQGRAGLPLETTQQVLRYFPRVAHAGVRRAVEARGPHLDALCRRLAQTPYDRVVLSSQRSTATVVAGREVVGVLNFTLTAEARQLRVDSLTPNRPR